MSQAEKGSPWMVAVWPGMGHVAVGAGFYLLAKLAMHELADLSANGLFDVDYVDVKGGRIQPTHRPRNRFFIWKNPDKNGRDIIVFIGESQPPLGKYAFCETLLDFARGQGVSRVYTFAAMATQMRPSVESRVFTAATNDDLLAELDRPDVYRLHQGNIGGLNGVLLGVALDKGIPGVCLLGEMPHLFAQLPYPKASLAVLRIFTELVPCQLDFTELENQASAVDAQLTELTARLESQFGSGESESSENQVAEEDFMTSTSEKTLSDDEFRRIETLFDEAKDDRSKAYELKNELDRLQVFKQYEDRFLDLFKQD